MSMLKFSLLGCPIVGLDEHNIDSKARKMLTLLVYLDCRDRRPSRDIVATRLWPQSGKRKARVALYRLAKLDRAPEGAWLETECENVALVGDKGLSVDVSEFEEILLVLLSAGCGIR